MILTIALNPGIEKYIEIDNYNEGETMPVNRYDLRIAGSSVYSAYIMRLLQADPYVLGFAGGIGGRYIKNFLDKSRIKSNLITKDKELKMTMIITNEAGIVTKLVDDEEAFTSVDAKNIKHILTAQIDEAELALVNGSVLHEGSREILHQSIDLIKDAHKHWILSIEGNEVLSFIENSPMSVLLSEAQVDLLTDQADGLEDVLEQLRQICVQNKIHYIFFNSGDGLIGVTRNKITSASIDNMVAEDLSWRKEAIAGAMAIGVKRRYEFEKILKLMTSVSYAVSEEKYPILCTRKHIETLAKKVKLMDYYCNGKYKNKEVLDEL